MEADRRQDAIEVREEKANKRDEKTQKEIEDNHNHLEEVQKEIADKKEGGFQEYVIKKLQLQEQDVNGYSPLVLAYMGDCVYELLIRTKIVNGGNMQVNKMHKQSAKLVKASAQAELVHRIMELLTDTEKKIYKRGRNAKSATMAKNATMAEYRTATGFEALIGYLYLSGQKERLVELVCAGLEKMEGFYAI